MPNIIGLVGRKGCGKDTVGKILVEDYGFTRVAFADKVKEVCKIVFGLTDDEMNNPSLKEVVLDRWPYESPRSLMQKVGTESFRTIWPDVWMENVKRKIDNEGLEKVVITDVRFENELLVSRSRNGINIRVDASQRLPKSNDQHASEALADVLMVQDTVDNNGDIEQLKNEVRRIMEKTYE